MKTLCHALALSLCLSAVHAQEPEKKPEGRKGPFGGGEMRMKMKERFLENLAPEDRKRFEAAREKALQDPKIQELREKVETANREFFGAMRKKMMEIDPGLEEIVKNARGGEKDRPKGMREGRRDGALHPGGFGDLTDAEKEKLLAARKKAGEDPAVQAAEKRKNEASTPEERKAASDEFRKAMHAALLKVDPALAPILEKMAPKPPPPPGAPAGGREMMEE